MKIGVDIRALMDRQYSGVSWYVLDLLSAILRSDKKNEYFLYYNSGKNISGRLPKLESENVKIVFTKYPNKLFNYFLQKILRFPKLDELSGGVEKFWLPHLNFASFSGKCQTILTVHDLSFLLFPEFFSGRKNFWHKLLGAKKMISGAGKIIAISENTKQDLIDIFNIPPEKIKVIPSGLGAEFQPLQKADEYLNAVKKKYSLPEKFILNIGTIEPRKNISGLVEAFDAVADLPALKDYFLLIVGGRGWKNKDIFRTIRAAKNKDRIRVIGYIKKEERGFFYNSASIFCYPSFYEGFGLPILEAMASGVPVITSAVSALPEAAGDAALYIDPNDSQTISQALRQLAENENLRRELISKGITQSKKFSWDKTAAAYLEVFNEL